MKNIKREGGAAPFPLLPPDSAGHEPHLHCIAAALKGFQVFPPLILHTEDARVGVDVSLFGGHLQLLTLDVHHHNGGGWHVGNGG